MSPPRRHMRGSGRCRPRRPCRTWLARGGGRDRAARMAFDKVVNAAMLRFSEVYRDALGIVSMAGLSERHEPGRVVAVEGDIEARDGAPSIAGSTDAHDRRCRP